MKRGWEREGGGRDQEKIAAPSTEPKCPPHLSSEQCALGPLLHSEPHPRIPQSQPYL